MTSLDWDEANNRFYESGCSHGVFYPKSLNGVPWNGLISIQENTSGQTTSYYQDGYRFSSHISVDSYSASVKAYTYPHELEDIDILDYQSKQLFDFSYRSLENNIDTTIGYKIHLLYNVLATGEINEYESLDQDVDVMSLDWNFSTKPVLFDGIRPTAHFVISSVGAHPDALAQLEDILYGTDTTEPRMPTIDEVMDIFSLYFVLTVTNLPNGVVEIDGPDEAVMFLEPTVAQISWPSVIFLNSETFQVSSL